MFVFGLITILLSQNFRLPLVTVARDGVRAIEEVN
jgi:hypothetical protein